MLEILLETKKKFQKLVLTYKTVLSLIVANHNFLHLY